MIPFANQWPSGDALLVLFLVVVVLPLAGWLLAVAIAAALSLVWLRGFRESEWPVRWAPPAMALISALVLPPAGIALLWLSLFGSAF